jgi:hypothetical protein
LENLITLHKSLIKILNKDKPDTNPCGPSLNNNSKDNGGAPE